MGTKDRRIDEHIARSPDFAKPILKHLRRLVHAACPEVEETLRWGSPTFMHHGILCGMASFKSHCMFGFWKGALLLEPGAGKSDEAMGQFGRIQSRADLPSDAVLTRLIRKAAKLNEEGVKLPARRVRQGREVVVPDDLTTALGRNKAARKAFGAFSPSHKREYVEWITEAKTEATRQKRLRQAIEWMAEGRPRNWKYMRTP